MGAERGAGAPRMRYAKNALKTAVKNCMGDRRMGRFFCMGIFKALNAAAVSAIIAAAAFAAETDGAGRYFGDIIDYGAEYLSPEYLAADPDSGTLFAACKTGDRIIAVRDGKVAGQIPLGGRASGIALAPGGIGYATVLGENGRLCKLDLRNFKVLASWEAGHMPTAPAASPDGKYAYFANQFTGDIRKLDAATGRELARGRAAHEPYAMRFTPDGGELVIVNHLPEPKGGLYEENIACAVSILNPETLETAAKIELPNGAIDCKDVAFSPDGKYAYVTYVLARFNVPTTQLERGWINTNAVAVIDLKARKRLASFLLDENTLGAANPWGLAVSPDGATLAVATSGTHEIHLVDLRALHEKFSAPRGVRDPAIEDDLNFLSGIRERIDLEGLGPRGVAWLGGTVYAAEYYGDDIAAVDTEMDNEVSHIGIGGNPEMTSARKGDLFFNDARMCFQQWLSCSTCHPSTRSDNLNWDLVNDGICNPKQSKSMLFSHFTPPTMITGVRKDAETCVRAGLIHIQFVERGEEDAVCVDDFMKRLKPVPSPHAPGGELSESALNGQVLFETAGCSACHKGEYFTDMKLHDLGTAAGPDEGRPFDTPTLREVWRSAPYLYDGRAKTIFDMMKNFNENGRHGNTKELSDEELRDLEAYVLTL